MCGRFTMTLPADTTTQLFDAVPNNDLPSVPDFNVCPTQQIYVIVPGDKRRLVSMRWGFIPRWYKSPMDGPLLINARSEAIAQKPAFREACRMRRCLIPISGFYEWSKTLGERRQPWYVHAKEPLVVAGIWQDWGPGKMSTCAIVTCSANKKMRVIHARMPVILKRESWGHWMGETDQKAASLMTAVCDDFLQYYSVDTSVNSNKATGAGLILPMKAHLYS